VSYSFNGPSFGGHDLDIWDQQIGHCGCRKRFYEKPIRESVDKFIIEECEVFQIVKG